MQANAGFIQYIGHAYQAGTDLGRQADPLRLTSGQRSGSPGKGQIFQPHIQQEVQSCLDLLQYLGADRLLHRRQTQLLQKTTADGNGKLCHLIDILLSHGHGQRTFLQPLPLAPFTGGNPHESLIFCLGRLRKGLSVTPLHIAQQSLKSHIIDTFPPLSFIVNLHLAPLCAINQHIVDLRRIFLKGSIQAELILLSQSFQNRMSKASLVCAGLPPHHGNRSLRNT